MEVGGLYLGLFLFIPSFISVYKERNSNDDKTSSINEKYNSILDKKIKSESEVINVKRKLDDVQSTKEVTQKNDIQ